MCGIVGSFCQVHRGFLPGDSKALRDLAIANTVRGFDGTGLLFMGPDSKVKSERKEKLYYFKDAVTASELLSKEAWPSMLNESRFAVVHNRAATIGTVDEEHTHPFLHTNCSGVHNGTVTSWRYDMKEHAKDAKMDSDAIIKTLSAIDPDPETVGTFLASIHPGAYSLVWYDNRVQQLRFARNSQRPMNFLQTTDRWWFGSELKMLEWALGRNRLVPKKSFATKEHTLIGLPVAGGEAEYHDYSGKVPKYRGGSTYGSGYHYAGQRDYGYRGTPVHANLPAPTTGPAPTHISTSRMGYISFHNSISNDSRSRILEELSGLAGSRIDVRTTYDDVDEALADFFDEKVDGLEINLTRGNISVPVHIVYEKGNKFYGYILVDGMAYVMSTIQATDGPTTAAIKEILKGGHECIVNRVVVYGVKAYPTGDAGYYGGGIFSKPADLEEGESLMTEDGKTMRLVFGEEHPDIVAQKLHTDGAIAWNDGWSKK